MFLEGLLASVMTFGSPVNFDMSLAGNFGEPRRSHFHGGIDIRTEREEDKPVLSIGDGYVSRIVVGLYGYGKAVFVRHPEGYTSMYCHLNGFAPRIESICRRWQYKLQRYGIDVELSPTDCPVSRGQLIAASGNTGASQAPHLHLEMYDNTTGLMVDPLDFLGSYIKDTVKPTANGFRAYPQTGEGLFCDNSDNQSYAFSATNQQRRYTAWGKVGFGLWANDYMDNTYNRYGIRETKLTVDGRTVFHSVVDRLSKADIRMVSFCGDYDFYSRHGVWYMKAFLEPGVRMAMVTTDENNGLISFTQERDYHLEYTITDYAGNSNTYDIVVTGKKTDIAPSHSHSNVFTRMELGKANVFQLPNAELSVRQRSLARSIDLQPIVKQKNGAYSDVYSFYGKSCPLQKWAKLSLRCKKKVDDPRKLYIRGSMGPQYSCIEYKDGWVTGLIRNLGAFYEIAYDDVPPSVMPVRPARWMSDNTIVLSVKDSESGIKQISGYIDGEFILFENKPKSSAVICNLEKTPIRKKKMLRNLKIVVSDNANNEYVYTSQIIY